jgi:hypothetical protein
LALATRRRAATPSQLNEEQFRLAVFPNPNFTRNLRLLLPLALFFCAFFSPTPLTLADNPPGDSIGAIEGDSISVEGPMSVEVVHGQVKTVLRSGSDVHVKSGQARINLIEGGQITICGPAHFSVLKSGGALTLALDSGTIHAHIESEPALTVYTAQIQAHPLSIGGGGQDALVGLDAHGAMCIRAYRGAVRIEQQLTGQSVLIPQNGDVSLINGQIETLRASAGRCACELMPDISAASIKTEISTLATADEARKHAAEQKAVAPQTQPSTPAQNASQNEEPIYQVFLPPLRYDAKAKVQPDYDPSLIVVVRRVRVRPTLIFQGKVEGDAVVAQNSQPVPKPASTQQSKPADPSTWTRVRTYWKKLWSPSS